MSLSSVDKNNTTLLNIMMNSLQDYFSILKYEAIQKVGKSVIARIRPQAETKQSPRFDGDCFANACNDNLNF